LFIWPKFACGRPDRGQKRGFCRGGLARCAYCWLTTERRAALLQRNSHVDHRTRVGLLRQGVKYLLHIIVLFELVDHRQNFRRLFFRQLGWNGADILVLG